MKKLLTLGTLFVASAALAACTLQDPVKYNDTIVDVLSGADDAFASFDTYATETDITYVDKMQTKLTEAIAVQDQKIKEIEALGAYDDDDSFQKVALTYLKTNKDLLSTKRQAVLTLWKNANANDKLTKAQEKEINAKANKINKEMREAIEQQVNNIVQAQKAFSKKHNYGIEEETQTGSTNTPEKQEKPQQTETKETNTKNTKKN